MPPLLVKNIKTDMIIKTMASILSIFLSFIIFPIVKYVQKNLPLGKA